MGHYLKSRADRLGAGFSSLASWTLLPSFVFFIVLPLLLRRSLTFGLSMLLSCAVMVLSYSRYLPPAQAVLGQLVAARHNLQLTSESSGPTTALLGPATPQHIEVRQLVLRQGSG
jgi:hypothetical protein